jgi:hypothetical protein
MSGFCTRCGALYEISQPAATFRLFAFVLKVELALQLDDLLDDPVLYLIRV